jgi:hypothetical protein
MEKVIKMYGERNTNTNYMSQLIKLNLDAQEMSGVVPKNIMKLQRLLPGDEWLRDRYFKTTFKKNLGWKHSCVELCATLKVHAAANTDLCFLSITKNPYSWLLSLHRKPYHQGHLKNLDFETFLTTPWHTVTRDNTQRVLPSPIQLWNLKNASYLKLTELNGLNITTESIFDDPEAVINNLSNHFSIPRLSDDFVHYTKSTKEAHKDTDYYRDYYLKEKWREKLSKEAIETINASINKPLMASFGYEVLSS